MMYVVAYVKCCVICRVCGGTIGAYHIRHTQLQVGTGNPPVSPLFSAIPPFGIC